MANALLTVDMITKESLMILHQKLTFIGNINRAYDDSFAQEGAKIGDTLRIRLPNEYVVRSGATLSTQDTNETQVSLVVSTQKGVDLDFTSKDLTLDMEIFSQRIIDPAMSVLAAAIESDALTTMTKDVFNVIDSDGSTLAFKDITDANAQLSDNLAPVDNSRTMLLSNSSQSTIVDALKGLFQDTSQISDQYLEGMMGRTGGFNFFSSSHVSLHQTGTAAKTTGYLTDGAGQVGSSIIVDTGTTTFLIGDVITFTGVNRVHPETKVDTGIEQQFVITADSGASATTLAISPAVVATGGSQNVVAAIGTGVAVVKVGAGASETMTSDLAYHKNAFTFATADLILPDGVDFASRQVFDGISMRIIRQYDITSDTWPVRLDVCYGFKTIRAQLATRVNHG